MSKLDHLVAAARESRGEWSPERADRVFAGTVAARAKAVRRSIAAVGVVVAVAFVLLRGSTAPAAPSTTDTPAELVAYDSTGDGGLARD